MRYEAEGGDPANAGLQHARVFLEPVKEKHPWITYSEWVPFAQARCMYDPTDVLITCTL